MVKEDVKELLALFDLKPTLLQKGDLVLTAEIHRVEDPDWGKKNRSTGVSVAGVFPECYTDYCKKRGECVHTSIRDIDPNGGQNVIMKPRALLFDLARSWTKLQKHAQKQKRRRN